MDTQADDGDVSPLPDPHQDDAPSDTGTPQEISSIEIPATRASRLWIRILPALIVLAVILVFVFQNTKDVRVSFFAFSGELPLSASLLSAAALGALLVMALGSVRIIQLRKQVRRQARETRHRDE
jgi:uncharacterized integral membrane protein